MTLSLGAIRMPFSALAFAALFLIPHKARAQDDTQSVTVNLNALAQAASPPPPTAQPSAPAVDAPIVEWPLKRLYCVEYARLRSGLAIFGDARLWWNRAKNLYDEFKAPAVDAVMVFSGSKRIAKGHVAVVTQILNSREIVVDHANWQNHGEIDRNFPVLDVSESNDWSKVRVWDVNSGKFGAHVYRISGFIAGSLAPATGS